MASWLTNHRDIIKLKILQIKSSVKVISRPNISIKYMHFLLYIPVALLSNLQKGLFACLTLIRLLGKG
jgi:hypothetical protein